MADAVHDYGPRPSVRIAKQAATVSTLVCLVLLAFVVSLASGARPIAVKTVATAFVAFDPDNFDHQAVFLFRLPRLIAAILVGAALAVTGVLMQALVRNPLAEPQLLGLNSGAALAVVGMSVAGLDGTGLMRPIAAAVGALVTFAIVLGISSVGRTGPTPLKVTLGGVIVSAFASSLTSAMLLLDDLALEDLRLWLAGDLAAQSAEGLILVAPVIGFAILAAFLVSPRLTTLALGEDVARGLGVNVGLTRLSVLVISATLCGAAVTLAGPIGFIGLIVPQLARRIAGENLRYHLILCLLSGPLLLLGADMLARHLIAPAEIATGVVTGGLGATFFIILVARYFR